MPHFKISSILLSHYFGSDANFRRNRLSNLLLWDATRAIFHKFFFTSQHNYHLTIAYLLFKIITLNQISMLKKNKYQWENYVLGIEPEPISKSFNLPSNRGDYYKISKRFWSNISKPLLEWLVRYFQLKNNNQILTGQNGSRCSTSDSSGVVLEVWKIGSGGNVGRLRL